MRQTADLRQAIRENVWLHFYQLHRATDPEQAPIIVRGEGSKVWDTEGKEYIDALAGLFCVNVGYGRREIAEAMMAQLEQIHYVSPFSFPNVPGTVLADRVANLAPTGPDSRVFFVSGGSEAVESALKLAKQYQRRRGQPTRYKTISRRVAYHGTTMGALSVNGLTAIRNQFGPLVPGARHVPPPYRYRCHLCQGRDGCTLACADEVARLIEFEGPETVAALIMEPVQNSGGAIPAPPGYFQRIREICDEYGVVMIMDEVICGFGRTGRWFGSDLYEVRPDIITVAKGITSAYAPLGAAIASRKIAEVFEGPESEPFMHGITFGGHPVSAAAALANLDIMERERLVERSAAMGDYLMQRLQEALGDHPNVGDIRGAGLFIGIELVKDRETKEPMTGERLVGWLSDELLRRGVIC
ncbi:MAG: aminotransferase class III-fold pyridoxal phosphate-dependent enzyme, partial [Thermomicrobiaceae bacterium]|nr:aminotransferase class III-fold pyridoxal phosphate-dependent enzyme [Thermomicrobiaceae bacterium]